MAQENRAPDVLYRVRIGAVLLSRSNNVPMLTDTVGERCVRLRTDDPPKAMELVRARFKLPPTEDEIVVNAMITSTTRVADGGVTPGAILEFYALDGDPARRWDEFMNYVRANYPQAAETPVTLAGSGATDQVQRKFVRHPAKMSVRMTWGGLESSHNTSDVSLGGMFVQTLEPPAVGSLVTITVDDGRASEPFVHECVVMRRVFGTQGGIGLEFFNMSDGSRRQFARSVRPIVNIGDFVDASAADAMPVSSRARPISTRP
jgi:hypothetical protein